MDKQEAINLLGGSPAAAAREIGVTTQAITGWPDPLTEKLTDRVQAALWRKAHGIAPPIRRGDKAVA
jgi:hypothetical protein